VGISLQEKCFGNLNFTIERYIRSHRVNLTLPQQADWMAGAGVVE
jgi:hypothetical protein